MSNMIEPGPPVRRPNPLIWIGLIVIGLIMYIFLSADRGGWKKPAGEVAEAGIRGKIESSLLIPPGMRARQYIAKFARAISLIARQRI